MIGRKKVKKAKAPRLESMVQFSHAINEYGTLHLTYTQKGA
jgi:hypothetical protein